VRPIPTPRIGRRAKRWAERFGAAHVGFPTHSTFLPRQAVGFVDRGAPTGSHGGVGQAGPCARANRYSSRKPIRADSSPEVDAPLFELGTAPNRRPALQLRAARTVSPSSPAMLTPQSRFVLRSLARGSRAALPVPAADREAVCCLMTSDPRRRLHACGLGKARSMPDDVTSTFPRTLIRTRSPGAEDWIDAKLASSEGMMAVRCRLADLPIASFAQPR